ncbi:hypothetical protein [Nonomuraea typhae]|uniref:Uncharacterized protein n=1 Tax=Nonomuraea typhae TaxID=2603600 RepID=A0ABW7ZCB4_9ACTN
MQRVVLLLPRAQASWMSRPTTDALAALSLTTSMDSALRLPASSGPYAL